MNLKYKRTLGYGARSVALIALVLVAVILLNAGMTVLCRKLLLYSDMTADELYTVTEATVNRLTETFDQVNADRLAKGQEAVSVDIIFCADPDMIMANGQMRYVYYTALNLQKQFPDTIHVSAVNVWENPSAVDAYRTNSYSSIYQSNIIVASGSEFRVTTARSYFVYDTDSGDTPWAYNGEKKLVQNITNVTKAESPICAITYNHGEPFDPNAGREDQQYAELLNVIEHAGYDVCFLDLEKEAIPKDCRLILTFDPQSDFVTASQSSIGVSELTKLDAYLAESRSFMVFVDADTPKLKNLEEILQEWGIAFDRYTEEGNEKNILGNYQIYSANSVDAMGSSIIGSYETEGTGASITRDMREMGGSPKVVFGNAMSISYSDSFEETFVLASEEYGTGAFSYGSYYRNNHARDIFDVFRSDENSMAYAVQNGQKVLEDPVDTRGGYRLMTLTKENRTYSEGRGYTTVDRVSYVCAVGSTEFASDHILGSNTYGNTDLLLETLRAIGRETEPIGIEFKPISSTQMTQKSAETGDIYYTQGGIVAWTVVLMVIPAVGFSLAGVLLLVKRRRRT